MYMCVCACVRACVRAYMRACMTQLCYVCFLQLLHTIVGNALLFSTIVPSYINCPLISLILRARGHYVNKDGRGQFV